MISKKIKDNTIKTLTNVKVLCVESESYEEITEINDVIGRIELVTSYDEMIELLKISMVYITMARDSYIKRKNQ